MDAFARLQRQLKAKPYLTAQATDRARTYVVIADHLYGLTLLTQPQTYVVLVRSTALPPAILDYYLAIIFPDTDDRAKAKRRLKLVTSSAQRLLNSPQQRTHLRKLWPKKIPGVLLCSQVTPLEQRLAFALQLPIFGVEPTLAYLATKSGARALFRAANVPIPFGREHIRSLDQLGQALLAIHKHDRTVKHAVVKLDYQYGSAGQALIPLTKLPRSASALEKFIRRRLKPQTGMLTVAQFLQRIETEGGVAEEWLVGPGSKAPSVQLSIQADGEVICIATQQQQSDGIDFPARPSLRSAVNRQAVHIGEVLSQQHVVGPVTVDFITMQAGKRSASFAVALHPRLTLASWAQALAQAVTHATLQPDGTLKRGKRVVHYVTKDAVVLPSAAFGQLKAVWEFVDEIGLKFDHRSHTGILVHRAEDFENSNRVGVMAIAKTHQAAEQLLVILQRALERYTKRSLQQHRQQPTGQVNRDRLVRTFIKYAKISSPSHHEGQLRTVLRDDLIALGVKTRIDRAGNLLGTVTGTGTPLLLCAHMDTVRPCERIRPVIRGEVIMTDGTSVLGADDKAGIAAIVETLQLLKESRLPHPPLELVFTTGEETFSDGAAELDYSLLQSPLGFVIDGGEIAEIDYRSAYLADIQITVRGKGAHSGVEPEKGISAIQIAAEAISHLKLGRLDRDTTANIGIIDGGSIRNAIPAEVFVHGEARSFSKRKIEDQLERMHKAFQDAAERYGGLLEINSRVALDGYTLSKTNPAIIQASQAMRQLGITPKLVASIGGTDANTFIKHGIQTVNIGTGGQNPHTVDEYISIPELVKCAQLIVHLCTQLS